MKRVIVSLCILGALAGCNTVGGMGRDIEKLGESISRSSSE